MSVSCLQFLTNKLNINIFWCYYCLQNKKNVFYFLLYEIFYDLAFPEKDMVVLLPPFVQYMSVPDPLWASSTLKWKILLLHPTLHMAMSLEKNKSLFQCWKLFLILEKVPTSL